MGNFTITIKNQSNNHRSFLLFQGLPKPNTLDRNNVFANIYQQSPAIDGTGDARTTFSMEQRYFAVCGTAQPTRDGFMRVNTADTVPVRLGPNGTSAAVTGMGGYPTWDRSRMTDVTNAQGALEIRTDNTFELSNHNRTYIGCGATDPRTGEVFPRPKYFIAVGRFDPGVIVDGRTLGQVLEVDFTGASVPSATSTLTNNGTYEADEKVELNGVKWTFGNIDEA
ncbi:uncharacterized protein N0V96_007785 [Colletotrichum fioriniae]|uniref:uncharacterized protein n=1 Tax=Colletotrichum fioriniae TaxID=710243 RepID=UPI0032DA1B4B|nr:hypothetical protein N0V96_007785 [Colletotrichum fioriniae]